ncbi:hypothetical protein Trydic_g10084, partial [Trypoxylus dichotomus]
WQLPYTIRPQPDESTSDQNRGVPEYPGPREQSEGNANYGIHSGSSRTATKGRSHQNGDSPKRIYLCRNSTPLPKNHVYYKLNSMCE